MKSLWRRLFPKCECQWEAANVLTSTDHWDRVHNPRCPRHGTGGGR